MSEISIQIPPLDEIEQLIEIEVRVNGERKKFNYRVEALRWESCEEPIEERAICIRKMVEGYDKGWQLVQIGTPTDRLIPLMFRERPN